jgi:hypothetical protein
VTPQQAAARSHALHQQLAEHAVRIADATTTGHDPDAGDVERYLAWKAEAAALVPLIGRAP